MLGAVPHLNPPPCLWLRAASFIPFALTIPSSARFTILGIRLTDKVFIFLAGLQVMMSNSPVAASMYPALCGLLAGGVYQSNVLRIKAWRFPEAAEVLARKCAEDPWGPHPGPLNPDWHASRVELALR